MPGLGAFCLVQGVCSWGVPGLGGLPGRGGVCSWGGVCLVWGVCLVQGGVCSSAPGVGGGISQHALRQTPPVDRQMPVKILPWPNFVAAGN